MPYGNKSAYEAQAKLKGQSPAYKKSSGFKMKSSPTKTKLGRWLMGRKKHVDSSGKITITDKRGNIVKTKEGDVTTKYKKGNRPSFVNDPHSAYHPQKHGYVTASRERRRSERSS